MKVLQFLKKNLVYGLAGFFAASGVLVAVEDFLNTKNIPRAYFWLLPIGFVAGLAFPRYVGHIFMTMVSQGSNDPEKELNPEETVKGPIAVIVKIIALAVLVVLAGLVLSFVKQDFFSK